MMKYSKISNNEQYEYFERGEKTWGKWTKDWTGFFSVKKLWSLIDAKSKMEKFGLSEKRFLLIILSHKPTKGKLKLVIKKVILKQDTWQKS